jgi:hypothetical protein
MSTTKDAIEKHDVVVLRVPVGAWAAGTTGTVVSLYEDAALVEVAEDDPPGSALDNLLPVPFEQLELCWSHRTGWVEGWKPDGSPSGRDRAAKRSTASRLGESTS